MCEMKLKSKHFILFFYYSSAALSENFYYFSIYFIDAVIQKIIFYCFLMDIKKSVNSKKFKISAISFSISHLSNKENAGAKEAKEEEEWNILIWVHLLLCDSLCIKRQWNHVALFCCSSKNFKNFHPDMKVTIKNRNDTHWIHSISERHQIFHHYNNFAVSFNVPHTETDIKRIFNKKERNFHCSHSECIKVEK